jgi:hypothetical protein
VIGRAVSKKGEPNGRGIAWFPPQSVAATNKQDQRGKTMRLKFAIGLAALTVGAALASVPAVAQQQGVAGYSSRGAVVAIHPYRHHRLYNYAPLPTHRHIVKTPDRLQNNGDM